MYLSHNEGEWRMSMELLLKILQPTPTKFYQLMTKNGLKIRFAKTALWCPLNYTIINRRETMDWRDLWFPATVVCGCICKMMLQTVGVLYLKSDQPVFSTVWHDWFIWSDINWLLSLSIYQKLITKVNSYLQTSFTWSSIIDQCCTPAAEDQYYLRVYTRGVVFFVLMGLLTSKFWFQHLHWSSIQCAVKIISYFVSTLNNTVWTTR